MARSAPDPEAPVSLAQHSFASGEVSPGFYGRQDIQKYASGCAVMRNWFIDPRGGATIRPGTQFLGQPATAGYTRLIPFQFSPDVGESVILVFSPGKLQFIKNPGTAHYPNGSNAGFIQSGAARYELTTPYTTEIDLRTLHYCQIADVMWITCGSCPRRKLMRYADDNWVLTTDLTAPVLPTPVMISAVVSPAPTGVTPVPAVETRYMYSVSAVGEDASESLPALPIISPAGINIGATAGTVTVSWYAVAGAQYYKVWKALPAHGNRVPMPHEQFGFCGYSYGNTFTDSNIVADFTRSPIQPGNPFAPAPLTGYSITATGSGYVPGETTITITDPTGTGAVVHPVLSTNIAAATGGIVGLYIAAPGTGYTAPVATAVGAGSGFTATFTIGPSTGLDPASVGLIQQRLIYASTANKPKSLFASRPGAPDDFRKTNPVVDSDAFEFEIFDQQVSRVYWMHAMPGGLLIGSNSSVMQLTGGSAAVGNPLAITPTNAVIVPQSQFGSADVEPIVVDHNILYVQREGAVRNLKLNFYFNIYEGSDLTILSNHLFAEKRVLDWAYQDVPNKVVWSVMSDGTLLSLTYVAAQEITGWARHDTLGIYELVATVQEGDVNAVYYSVWRSSGRCIERQAQQQLYQASDAWQLDCALSIASSYPLAYATLDALEGTATLIASAPVFAVGDLGKHIVAHKGRGIITQVTSTTEVEIAIGRPFPQTYLPQGHWRMDPVLSVVSGLEHMNGTYAYAVVDGVAQGPFLVTGGTITLTYPGSQVVVGYKYSAQLQPLYVEPAEAGTVQGKRKKVAAASIRVRDAIGLYYGPSFDTVLPWTEGTSSTDTAVDLPYGAAGLYSGDQRLWLDQAFDIGGWVCIQQEYPYPATVLSIMPELAMGDFQ